MRMFAATNCSCSRGASWQVMATGWLRETVQVSPAMLISASSSSASSSAMLHACDTCRCPLCDAVSCLCAMSAGLHQAMSGGSLSADPAH